MILDDLISMKKIRVLESKAVVPFEEVYNKAFTIKAKERNFKDVLKGKDLSVIGEFKKASPSKGVILRDFNIEKVHEFYKELKIDAYSVLTERDLFLGEDNYIKQLQFNSTVPILRKDFILDPYQIYETRVLGASGILLIVSVLKEKLRVFYDESKKIGLEPLVEIHDRRELELALECGCEIIGVNNRNLKTFETTLKTTEELIKYIPKNRIVISESGIRGCDDLRIIKDMGVDGVLVGEMFMRNLNNDSFIKEYKAFKGSKYED
ncbi:indole-3-glycerol phosphate synthase TrpC [Clostridium paraputrificum]|uniref:indole-3-glycerol phosphate synthase TrpC n=1 Tax=Clostridium paraputrificum TaxID=29363 RepID=UPI0034A54C72